mmetsp:Transcript_17054/g.49229  ORF Transcript_17054/g.49229 Transcript_17054/m.49229 type:complete len:572 (-) Transcript_17054:466-2181(-)
MTGSAATRRVAYNIIQQVERESLDDKLAQRASRMAARAGMPLDEPPPEKTASAPVDGGGGGGTSNGVRVNGDAAKRKREAEERKEWEASRGASGSGRATKAAAADGVAGPGEAKGARSALSARAANNGGKPDLFMPEVDRNLDPMEFADGKKGLEDALGGGETGETEDADDPDADAIASARASELVARAGSGVAFAGETLGIGGLDDVLAQVKRRVWVPLAAPPSLLSELGINPVRGLLFYGGPGCGKTLLARSLGKILSPARPVTVVSGPEIMDKFVGSSEANLRAIFDQPPDIYDSYRIGQPDDGKALEKASLHVVVMDEFDAVARSRGGGSGKGDQGDAGVARDSVVNQLLAKMDGVDPLVVPTLVIGLTNKRTLIEPALLRPGRFEVQIEVPPPRTVEQRVSILQVHMGNMFRAGRLLVRDAPQGTAAARRLERNGAEGVPTFAELLDLLAVECDGMSGASLAGVARAAASHALERAVFDFAGHLGTHDEYVAVEGGSIADCLVTKDDLEKAVEDVFESSKEGDGEGFDDATAEELSADSGGEDDDASVEESNDSDEDDDSIQDGEL